MTKKKTVAVFLATLLAFIWGLSFLSIKVAVSAIPPMSLGLFRFVIATIVLFIIFAVMRKKIRVDIKDIPILAAAGFVGVTLYFLGENNGVMLLSASEASIIIGTIPVLAMLVEGVVIKTKLGKWQYLGAILSTIGVALIVIESMKLSPSPLGYFFMVVAAISWVAYAFLTRHIMTKYDSLEIALWQTIFGTIGFIPFVLTEHIDLALITMPVVLNVLYLGIFCSALGYVIYVITLQVLGAGVSSVFLNLIPVFSVAASFVLLDERLSLLQIFGAFVALCGVYLASLAANKSEAANVK